MAGPRAARRAGFAWITQGTGVIENDTERNIFIPDELTMPLQVQSAYNGDRMRFFSDSASPAEVSYAWYPGHFAAKAL